MNSVKALTDLEIISYLTLLLAVDIPASSNSFVTTFQGFNSVLFLRANMQHTQDAHNIKYVVIKLKMVMTKYRQ